MKQLLGAILVAAGLLLSTQPLSAQTTPPSPESQRTIREGRKEDLKNAMCSKAVARINARIKYYETHHAQRQERFHTVINRVSTLLAHVKEKGYDTTQVESNVTTFDEMVKKAADDYTVFILKLEVAKGLDCGSGDGSFMAKINEAVAALKTYRTDISEISLFVKNNLKPSIKALKLQSPKTSPDTHPVESPVIEE